MTRQKKYVKIGGEEGLSIRTKLTPKNDVIFQIIFSQRENQELLRDFLSSILGRPIEGELEVQNEVTLPRLFQEEKTRKIRFASKNKRRNNMSRNATKRKKQNCMIG